MHWNTVTPLLREVLTATMASPIFDPVCLLGKQWPLIKLDFVEWVDSR